MLFVCWLWQGRGFWKQTAKYSGAHVARLRSMLERHGGHDLICVHDGNFEIPDGVQSLQMPEVVAALPDYLPKLWAWSREFHEIVGERFASIDLDVVITDDIGPLLTTWDRLRIWGHARGELYNTSLFVLEPGTGNAVWDLLSIDRLEKAHEQAAYWTGDQSWVAYVLGGGVPTFGESDGVMQYRPALHRARKPPIMRAGFMCGPYEPFSEAQHSAWVAAAYQ